MKQHSSLYNAFSFFMERSHLHHEEFRPFKKTARKYIDDRIWQWICDEYNVELNNLRKSEKEESQ